MERAAAAFGTDPLTFRTPYLLRQGDPTITGGKIHERVIMKELIDKAMEVSGFSAKRARYENEPYRGIGISLFNHGCGFTGDGEQRLIKGKARLRKRADDTVEILVANIDMGQGPKTTFPKVVGKILNIPPEDIGYDNPDTDKVPNSGPTVASRTMMIVGYLVQGGGEETESRMEARGGADGGDRLRDAP